MAVWKNVYYGEDYICLRDEFLVAEPKPLSQEVREVVVLFGGTDPSNLTEKANRLAKKIHPRYPHMHFTFIVGIGYDSKAHGVISCEGCNITVIQNAKVVSADMKRADLALTSQGRTVYELAALGIPAVVMAQNEREQLHIFAQMQNGLDVYKRQVQDRSETNKSESVIPSDITSNGNQEKEPLPESSSSKQAISQSSKPANESKPLRLWSEKTERQYEDDQMCIRDSTTSL